MAYPDNLARTKNWGSEILSDTDLEGQLDLIINWVDAFADETSGHKHDGTTNEGPKIILTAAAGVTGTLPVANGGTGQATLAAFLNLIYPVGSVYINAGVDTNPGTLLGFGTWAAFGAGKVIIGIDGTDTDFDALTDTGGAKEVTLTETELPAHTHTDNMYNDNGWASGDGVQASGTSAAAGNLTTDSTGDGAAFSILNPYVTAYFWKRTA